MAHADQEDRFLERIGRCWPSLELEAKSIPALGMCPYVYLNRREKGGQVGLYHGGRLVARRRVDHLDGVLEVPPEMHPSLLRDHFENVRLEQALMRALERLPGLKRPGPRLDTSE